MTITSGSSVLPLLKWPGGKRALIGAIKEWIPKRYGTFIEPFCGGAALFFCLQPTRAMLADKNAELISFYEQVKLRPAAIGSAANRIPNDSASYYSQRASIPKSNLARAVRFLYLNRTSFAGMYRTNALGEFNVPFGNNGRDVIADLTGFCRSANALKRAKLRCCDFEESCGLADRGDLVFLDPPYTVAHENNGFVKYNASIFKWSDQERLREAFERLRKRGVKVLMTNASHSSIRGLYKGCKTVELSRVSRLAAHASARRAVKELLIVG